MCYCGDEPSDEYCERCESRRDNQTSEERHAEYEPPSMPWAGGW